MQLPSQLPTGKHGDGGNSDTRSGLSDKTFSPSKPGERGSEPVPAAAILCKSLRRSGGIITPGMYKALPQSTARRRSRSGALVNHSLLPTCPHGVSLAREYQQDGGSLE